MMFISGIVGQMFAQLAVVMIVTILLVLMDIVFLLIGGIAQLATESTQFVQVVVVVHPMITIRMMMMIGFIITIVMASAHTPLIRMVLVV